MIDYHVHTSLCNHANGTMEQYVLRAIELGLAEICFLDHLTLHEKGRHNAMSIEELPFYFYTARQLAAKFQHHIQVKVGLEIDFYREHADQIVQIISPYAFDVLAGSVHFVDDINIVTTKRPEPRRDQVEIEWLCEKYLENLDFMLDTGWVDIICHLDVYKKFGRRPPESFNKKFDEILSKISYKNLIVELNTSGQNHAASEFYPSPQLLQQCFEKKVKVTLGSDAHQPGSVGQHYDKAIAVLLQTGYRQVSAFYRRKHYELALTPKPVTPLT